MTRYYRIRLKFLTSLHVSQSFRQPEQTRDTISGDTLSAAILACAFQLGFDADSIMDSFQKIRISSAYPFYRDTHFFPKPFTRIPPLGNMESDPGAGKKLKKIQYLSQDLFEQVLQGIDTPINEDVISGNGKYAGIQVVQSFIKHLHERVQIETQDGYESTPFTMQNIAFHPEGGLHFMISCTDEGLPDWFLLSLKLLSDNGIGGDRNVGYGSFMYSAPEFIQFSSTSTSSYFVSLAPVFPDNHIIGALIKPDAHTAWKMKMSEGYISSPADSHLLGKRRKAYMQLMEGAVIKSDILPDGLIRDVSPDVTHNSHPVWRDGRGFWLPIKPL